MVCAVFEEARGLQLMWWFYFDMIWFLNLLPEKCQRPTCVAGHGFICNLRGGTGPCMVGWIILLGSGLDFTICAHHRSYGTRWVRVDGLWEQALHLHTWPMLGKLGVALIRLPRCVTTLCQCTRVHSGPADHVDFLEVFGRRSKELASNIFEAKFQGTLGLVRTIVNKSGI